MTASVRVLGAYPHERTEITGTLAEVLAVAGPAGVFGVPSDVPGVEMRHDGSTWAFNGIASVASTTALDTLVSTGFRGQAVVDGVMYAYSPTLGRMVAQRPQHIPFPDRGPVVMFGTSTTMRGVNVTAGSTLQSYESVIGEANNLLGSPWTVFQKGAAGITFDALLAYKDQIYACNPSGVVLQAGGNDLDSTEASAETLFPKVQQLVYELLSRGIAVAVQTPHWNGTNWRGALFYGAMMQEWCAYMGIPCISGEYCINAATDYIGTAKMGTMNVDGIHVNDFGCRSGYAPEWKAILRDRITRRILSGGSAQVSSELMLNPRMLGSVAIAGAEATAGFSGTKPTGYSLYKAGTFGAGDIVCTVATDSDGLRYFQLTIPWGASNDYITVGDTAVSLTTKTAWKFRALADFDVVTAGTLESMRTYTPFATGSLQHPNGNASNFSGTMLSGRRLICSPQMDTAITGTTLNLGSGATGVRFSASAAGTTVLRIYGISCRESRW